MQAQSSERVPEVPQTWVDAAMDAGGWSETDEQIGRMRHSLAAVASLIEKQGRGQETSGESERREAAHHLLEHGTSSEAIAARTLRKFMCCQAGRDLVVYGLLRPFRLTVTGEPAAGPILEEAISEFEARAAGHRHGDTTAPAGWSSSSSALAYENAANYLREAMEGS